MQVGKEKYDLCIVGTGPAGIICALEFARLNPDKSILLIEYGGSHSKQQLNLLDDTIAVNNPVNHHMPYESTNKGLGGTSATWGGRCVMYDPVDFADRPVIGAENTWDDSLLKDVQQYLSIAAE